MKHARNIVVHTQHIKFLINPMKSVIFVTNICTLKSKYMRIIHK